jgi:hypothetical protein
MARAGFNDPIEPMDQANMRANGVRLLDVRRGRHVDFFPPTGRSRKSTSTICSESDRALIRSAHGLHQVRYDWRGCQAELVGAWPFDARDVGALSGRRQRRPTPAWCQSAGRTFRSPIRRPGAASLCEAYSPYQDLEPASSPPSVLFPACRGACRRSWPSMAFGISHRRRPSEWQACDRRIRLALLPIENGSRRQSQVPRARRKKREETFSCWEGALFLSPQIAKNEILARHWLGRNPK